MLVVVLALGVVLAAVVLGPVEEEGLDLSSKEGVWVMLESSKPNMAPEPWSAISVDYGICRDGPTIGIGEGVSTLCSPAKQEEQEEGSATTKCQPERTREYLQARQSTPSKQEGEVKRGGSRQMRGWRFRWIAIGQ